MLDTTRVNPALAQLRVVDAMHPGGAGPTSPSAPSPG
jgi:hypothetical protein